MHDVEAVAVGVVEGKHRRHAVPFQELADPDTSRPKGGVLGGGVGHGEPDARVGRFFRAGGGGTEAEGE